MICCIIGAGDLCGTPLEIPNGALIIAADGGLRHLEAARIVPDLIVGDFDSLGHVPQGENVISHGTEKDDTDTMLSIREALARGASKIIVYGGLGGRFDHSLANLQALSYIANQGAIGYLVGGGNICTVIKNACLSFDGSHFGIISVFSLGDEARDVDLIGLKYPLTKHTLTCDFPLGVSNEFIPGTPATVRVGEGMLAVIWSAAGFVFEGIRFILE